MDTTGSAAAEDGASSGATQKVRATMDNGGSLPSAAPEAGNDTPGESGPGSGAPPRDVVVIWDEALLAYDLGDHPLDPVRVELTMALAREYGLLDRPGVTTVAPAPAEFDDLMKVHDRGYLEAVRRAPHDPFVRGWGLDSGDNPIFPNMYDASALVCGASIAAAEEVWSGRATRSVNVAGGLHHAMPSRAHGFCVFNDLAVAIARLLDLGAKRIAYLDVDVHHGDGVQAIFWDDPRVLTVSVHETPLALFPGVSGFPSETGGSGAIGSAANVALPPGTGDAGWLRAFHAVVPSVIKAFQPEILITQCGCDSHALDPLADLLLSVDGQREIYLALERLAEEAAGGRWMATGGGGYGLVEVVPRAWTHLLGVMTGRPLDPGTAIPESWRSLAKARLPEHNPPVRMTDGAEPRFVPWQPDIDDPVDKAVLATRRAVFPAYGLDPDDPRD
jgi:acetoin utilization protein AcuC